MEYDYSRSEDHLMTFTDQVYQAADEEGLLSPTQVVRALNLHGENMIEAAQDLGPQINNAEALLNWLGY